MNHQVTRIKFADLLDRLLAGLYEADSRGIRGFISLVELGRVFGEDDVITVLEASRILEARGYIQCIRALGGTIDGRITGLGRHYVETGDTDVLRGYRDNPESIVSVNVEGDSNQVIISGRDVTARQGVNITEDRKLLFGLIDEVISVLKRDPDITEDRDDRVASAEAIKTELKKEHPNVQAVTAYLEELAVISSVGGLISKIVELFSM